MADLFLSQIFIRCSNLAPAIGGTVTDIGIVTTSYTAQKDGWINVVANSDSVDHCFVDLSVDGYRSRAAIVGAVGTGLVNGLPLKSGQTVTITKGRATISTIKFYSV